MTVPSPEPGGRARGRVGGDQEHRQAHGGDQHGPQLGGRRASAGSIAARAGTAQTMPLTTIGCTTAIGPACRALACSTNAQVARSWPTSQSGRRTR